MKRTIFFLVLGLIVLSVAANAQTIRIVDNIVTGKTVSANERDSNATYIPISYSGMAYPVLKGVFPDSIHIMVQAADSIPGKVYFQSCYGSGLKKAVDSVGVITSGATGTTNATCGVLNILVSRSLYTGRDAMNALYIAGGTVGVVAAHKIYMRIERYFTYVPTATQ